MNKYISLQETLRLRSKVLRNNLPLNECIFPTDQIDGAFHVGCFVDQQLIAVASLFPKQYQQKAGIGYQLRGMATDPDFAGKGFGSKLIDFAVEQLNASEATYLWCNARTSAKDFYLKKDFEITSPEFQIEGVGPHYEMILNLKNK
jgi:predicted GNAT family N-acyltransferase